MVIFTHAWPAVLGFTPHLSKFKKVYVV